MIKKMVRAYKKMGFKVRIWENEGEFNTYVDDLTTILCQFELSVKGGQKIVVDRKQMVASGNYKFMFDVYFHSDDNVEIEQSEDPYSVQIDVDDFKEYPSWFWVPSSEFDYFSFGGDDLDRMENIEYSAREIEKACKESVYFLFKDLSGKWRKKRASVFTKEDSNGIEETHLVWSRGGSSVDPKYSSLYKSIGDFGEYILERKRTGLATSKPSQFSISCVFKENSRDMEINIENVVIDTTYSHSKNQQRVEGIVREELRGLKIKNVMFSKQRKSLRIIAEVPTFKQGSLVQKVALLKLQKIARLESHADFVKAINYAFMDREDESMLSSIGNQARSFEDTEFGKEVSDLCSELIDRLDTLEELRNEAGRYTWH